MENLGHLALLLAAAFTAGALNAVAGGGSFLTLPALVFTGVPLALIGALSAISAVFLFGMSALLLRVRAETHHRHDDADDDEFIQKAEIALGVGCDTRQDEKYARRAACRNHDQFSAVAQSHGFLQQGAE